MPVPDANRRSVLGRQVGSMALSAVRVEIAAPEARAAVWHNAVARLGLRLPLFLVHDLGFLLTTPRGAGGWRLGPHDAAPTGAQAGQAGSPAARSRLLKRYRSVVELLASSEVIARASEVRLRDELVSVLLARILGDVYRAWPHRAKDVGGEDLTLSPAIYAGADVAGHFADFEPSPLWGLLDHLWEQRFSLLTTLELLDLDTLRLLGLFQGSGAELDGDLAGLLQILRTPDTADVVGFSLELLPSILETKRASASQTFSVDGFSSLERRGTIDSLVLSELGYDEELFMQKVLDRELFYYGHERPRDEERRLQYVLLDASASMRGDRQVFARGLALALIKKLTLQGDEVWVRFFDSRLHDLVRIARNGIASIPYLLGFQSERGRHYGRVFRQLELELVRLRREAPRRVVLHVITHGQCHLPVDVVKRLSALAQLHAVIVLPSQDVTLDYLCHFDHYEIVTAEALSSREGRRERALGIVQATGLGHGR